MKTVIAICGPRGAGKSELRKQIELHHPGKTIHFPFAYFLKRMLGQFMRDQGVSEAEIESALYGDDKTASRECFDGETTLWAMQSLGTEWRDLVSTTLWTNAWDHKVATMDDSKIILVDDLRFLHEVDVLRKHNSAVIRIYRPSFEPGDHPSESEFKLIHCDFGVWNGTNPEELYSRFVHMYQAICGRTL